MILLGRQGPDTAFWARNSRIGEVPGQSNKVSGEQAPGTG